MDRPVVGSCAGDLASVDVRARDGRVHVLPCTRESELDFELSPDAAMALAMALFGHAGMARQQAKSAVPSAQAADLQARIDMLRGQMLEALSELAAAEDRAIEECSMCDGSGVDAFEAVYRKTPATTAQSHPCGSCDGTGKVPVRLPLVATKVEFDASTPVMQRPLFGAKVGWVAVRPVGEAYGGKTHLGWLMGDLATSQGLRMSHDGTLTVSITRHNPAIYVPELREVIFGYASWWKEIKNEDDLKRITDLDVNNAWYVRVLKDLESTTRP